MATEAEKDEAIQQRNRLAEEFRDKKALESKLRKKLITFNNKIVRQYKKDLAIGRQSENIFEPELEQILSAHYKSVSKKFSGRISEISPDDVSLNSQELTLLKSAITSYSISRSTVQSGIISKTTRKDMATATKSAISETSDQDEISILGSSLLSRRLKSRISSIISVETQAVAEASKTAEFDVFAGKTPLSLENVSGEELTKEWITMGDEIVRPAHVSADSQLQKINDLFVVDGEKLRFPGDRLFGASLKNVINCRCSADRDTDKVFEKRRKEKDSVTESGAPIPIAPVSTEREVPSKPKPAPKDNIFIMEKAKPKRKIKPLRKSKKPLTGVEDQKIVKKDKPPKLPDVVDKLTNEEQGMVEYYKGSGFYKMNDISRNENAFSTEEVSSARSMINTIDSAIKKSKSKSNGVLFRGIRSEDIFKNAESLIGKEMPILTPQSTASNAGSSLTYSGLFKLKGTNNFISAEKNKSVIFKIRTKKGQSMLNLESLSIGNTGESEILLRSGGNYKVISVNSLTDNKGNVSGKVIEVDYNE